MANFNMWGERVGVLALISSVVAFLLSGLGQLALVMTAVRFEFDLWTPILVCNISRGELAVSYCWFSSLVSRVDSREWIWTIQAELPEYLNNKKGSLFKYRDLGPLSVRASIDSGSRIPFSCSLKLDRVSAKVPYKTYSGPELVHGLSTPLKRDGEGVVDRSSNLISGDYLTCPLIKALQHILRGLRRIFRCQLPKPHEVLFNDVTEVMLPNFGRVVHNEQNYFFCQSSEQTPACKRSCTARPQLFLNPPNIIQPGVRQNLSLEIGCH
jgi:hypothetical protein